MEEQSPNPSGQLTGPDDPGPADHGTNDAAPDSSAPEPKPVCVLLLDDDPANLLLRSAILRQQGYETLCAQSLEQAYDMLDRTDIAVLDYNLGNGRFGTEVATRLRLRHPHVPIIILSATLESKFGGVEDMHLLKGHSTAEDLLSALRSLRTKTRDRSAVVDAREFYYRRIAQAIGTDVLVQVLDAEGEWQYVNDSAAALLGHPRDWFCGKNCFQEMGSTLRDWREVLQSVSATRETYIDRTRRGLLQEQENSQECAWSVIAFSVLLHDGRSGVVITARVLRS